MQEPKEQALVVQTAYMELYRLCEDSMAYAGDLAVLADATGKISVVGKTIRKRRYCYAQYVDGAGRQRQCYLGPEDAAATQHIVDLLASGEWNHALDSRRSIRKMLVQAGFVATPKLMEGALLTLQQTGLLQSGVTMIGTPAYIALMHRYGYTLPAPVQTNDVDLSIDRLNLAMPDSIAVESVLKAWNDRISAIPTLSRKAGEYSLKIRGKDFHIDFLTNGRYMELGKSITIPHIGFPRKPFHFWTT